MWQAEDSKQDLRERELARAATAANAAHFATIKQQHKTIEEQVRGHLILLRLLRAAHAALTCSAAAELHPIHT